MRRIGSMTVPETEIKRTWPTSHINKRGNGLVCPERTAYHFLPCTRQSTHSPPVRHQQDAQQRHLWDHPLSICVLCNKLHVHMFNTLCVWQSPSQLGKYGKSPGTFSFLLFWILACMLNYNPFYNSLYPDVTHMMKFTRPSAFLYCKCQEAEEEPHN